MKMKMRKMRRHMKTYENKVRKYENENENENENEIDEELEMRRMFHPMFTCVRNQKLL